MTTSRRVNILDLARRYAAPAHEQLDADFGDAWGEVVYAIRRREDGPVKIGTTGSIPQRCASFLNASPEPIIVAGVMPGGQSLEHFIHRRHHAHEMFGEWYDPPEPVLEDFHLLARRQADAFRSGLDLREATLTAIREHDQHTRDMERLLANGMSYIEIGRLCDLSAREVRDRCVSMRALGFELGFRSTFAVRASASPRFDTPVRGVRRIG